METALHNLFLKDYKLGKIIFSFFLFIGLFQSTSRAQTTTHTTVTKTIVENLGTNVNSAAGELAPVITADGNLIYFVRDGHSSNYSKQDVWYCEKSAGTWSKAIHPPEPINHSGKNSSVSNVSTDGNQLLVRGAFEDGEY